MTNNQTIWRIFHIFFPAPFFWCQNLRLGSVSGMFYPFPQKTSSSESSRSLQQGGGCNDLIFSGFSDEMIEDDTRWAPSPVISGSFNSMFLGVVSPQLRIYHASCRGEKTLFVTRGPSCRVVERGDSMGPILVQV